MLRVNYKILPNRKQKEKSVGARSVHNSFYIVESHFKPNLSDSHGIFVDDYFGFGFSGKCENCSNNPKNGGSGICNCIMGQTSIT